MNNKLREIQKRIIWSSVLHVSQLLEKMPHTYVLLLTKNKAYTLKATEQSLLSIIAVFCLRARAEDNYSSYSNTTFDFMYGKYFT